MDTNRRTWHYGLIARWWGEFNDDGDDIAYFARLIEQNGQPAVDLGCGAGRLLARFRSHGLDVDGCDVSEDMIDQCRRRLERSGLKAELYTQAMNELDLPRRYRTAVMSGVFAIGGTRRDDLEGLRRVYQHLEPGGLLAFDFYAPNIDDKRWRTWLNENRPELPAAWPDRGDRKRCADGTEIELTARVADFDPLNQRLVREIKAEHRRDGEILASEVRSLPINLYFKSEVVLMLESVGFADIQVRNGLTDTEARPWEAFHLMFLARRGDGAG